MKLPNLEQVDDGQALAIGKLMVKRIIEEIYTDGVFDLTTDYSGKGICSGTFLSDVRDRKGNRLKFNYSISNQAELEYGLTSSKQAKDVDMSEEVDSEPAIDLLLTRQSKDLEFNEKFSERLQSVKSNGLTGHDAYLYAEYLIDLHEGFENAFENLINE